MECQYDRGCSIRGESTGGELAKDVNWDKSGH